MPTLSGRQRPIEKFASAAATCSAEAAAYGKCVVADYTSVHQDMCKVEFLRLKDCYLVRYFHFLLFFWCLVFRLSWALLGGVG
jgi:NADH dehydrogenase [ubiquinone] 1 alpha subcomplex assembly factor 8